MDYIDHKAKKVYSKEIIDKELVLKLKERLNLPVYVLENLILRYQDKTVDQMGELLKEKVVQSKDSLKLQGKIRAEGSSTLIDKVTVKYVKRKNKYLARLVNLAVDKVILSNEIITRYPRLLEQGLWAEIKLKHLGSGANGNQEFEIVEFKPCQRVNFDFSSFKEGVKKFTTFQWRSFLLRSIGIEALDVPKRKQLLLLSRLIPYVESNYNFVELGIRGTGKSYLYRQLSSESILVSGGKTTVANLFYNMGTKQVGLVGKWNVVAFDEVAYIDFKDKTAIQILKDYMESGAFSRGQEEINAQASMVFLGNINRDVRTLLHKSHLFEPFTHQMRDMALIDRFHFYLPGWEVDKLTEEHFTTHSGLESEYLSLALNELRNLNFMDAIDEYYTFNEEMDIRDKRAIRKTVSGYLKLLHPAGEFTKEDLKLYLDLAIEGRKRIKEQLVKMGSFEYQENSFAYQDRETKDNYYPSLAEDTLKPGLNRKLAEPGVVYIGQSMDKQRFSLLKLKVEMEPGEGKLIFVGKINTNLKKNIRKAFLYIKQTNQNLQEELNNNDFYVKTNALLHYIDADIGSCFFIALYSLLNNKSVPTGLLVTDKSSLYRKVNSNYSIEALKVEKENGQVKALLPVRGKRREDKVFVEVPRDIIVEAPYFIRV